MPGCAMTDDEQLMWMTRHYVLLERGERDLYCWEPHFSDADE